MTSRNYKKYMKKTTKKDYTLWQLFAVSFFGMLLVFTFIIKSFSPSVDVSIGEYKTEPEFDNSEEIKKVVDDRLALIQKEDQGRTFSELIKKTDDENVTDNKQTELKPLSTVESPRLNTELNNNTSSSDIVYKVFIGNYTTAEQAQIAKDIIIESDSNLTPIVKCLGANNYTLQVGIFKNKKSAEGLLYTIQANHLPARIVQDF